MECDGDIMTGEGHTQPFWKHLSEDQNSFWIRCCTREDIGQFSAGPINEAIPSCRNSL